LNTRFCNTMVSFRRRCVEQRHSNHGAKCNYASSRDRVAEIVRLPDTRPKSGRTPDSAM